MHRFALACLLASLPALAQGAAPDAPAAAVDGPGSGLHLALNVFGMSSFGGVSTLVTVFGGGTTTAVTPVTSSLQVGYQFDQNDLLLGIGLLAVGGGGTTLGFSVSPTYRRYLAPLKTGAIVPFAQGMLTFDILAPSGRSSDFALGVGGGGGAEWFFTQRFALVAEANLVYLHVNVGTNADAIGLTGAIGLALHL